MRVKSVTEVFPVCGKCGSEEVSNQMVHGAEALCCLECNIVIEDFVNFITEEGIPCDADGIFEAEIDLSQFEGV